MEAGELEINAKTFKIFTLSVFMSGYEWYFLEGDKITGEAEANRFTRIVTDGEKYRKRRKVIGRGGDKEKTLGRPVKWATDWQTVKEEDIKIADTL